MRIRNGGRSKEKCRRPPHQKIGGTGLTPPNPHEEGRQSGHGEYLERYGEFDRPGEREIERNPAADLVAQHISRKAVALKAAADKEQAAHELERPRQAGEQSHSRHSPEGNTRAAELMNFDLRNGLGLKLRGGQDFGIES